MSESVKEISLRDIIRVGIRGWRVLLGSAGCAFVIAVIYAILATPYYTTTVTLQPNIGTSSLGSLGALGQMAGQLGSLSSLAGMHLGDAETKEQNYMAVLRSRGLALRFIAQYDLMPVLFPARWNPAKHRWKTLRLSPLSRLRLDISRTLARISGDQGWRPPSNQPTAWDALNVFDRIRSIQSDRPTGMVRVRFTLKNPREAAKWANEYVALANEEIRDRVIREAKRALGYLNVQAKSTNITELRLAIFDLIQQRLEQIVFAKSRPDYAFQVIDPAMRPEFRSSPKRLLIIVVATIIGGAGGLMYVLIDEFGGMRPEATKVA
jgi:uncharacterized protein involved in exopolysaccharide biosynthesis